MTGAAVAASAAVVLAITVLFASLLFARRAEHAAQRAKASERNAAASARSAATARQQTEGMVAAFKDGRPSEVDNRPTCPMDGEPLAGYDTELGKPAIFTHADGSRHYDRMAGMAIPARPAEPDLRHGDQVRITDATTGAELTGHVTMSTGGNPVLSVDPQREPVQPSTVDTYFQRVETATAAGLVDPDKLRTGLADITRGNWLPEAPPPHAPIPDGSHRRMPDPTRAGRVAGARRTPPAVPPTATNGDGS